MLTGLECEPAISESCPSGTRQARSFQERTCTPRPASPLITGEDTPQERPWPCQQFVTTVSPEAKHFYDRTTNPYTFCFNFWFRLKEVNHPSASAWPINKARRGWGQGLRCPFLSASVSQSLPQPPCSLPRDDENPRVEENLSPY